MSTARQFIAAALAPSEHYQLHAGVRAEVYEPDGRQRQVQLDIADAGFGRFFQHTGTRYVVQERYDPQEETV